MASVGHIAIGMAAARMYHDGRRPRWSSMASWSALSLLPDVDVVGFALGVDYGDPWGHRGATHSLVLSVAIGLTIGLAARGFKRPVVRTALFASAVLASHAILDTMTDGGLGCALLWPFDPTRYFAPWRPIPVAPIGPDFFSGGGAIVALTELVIFSPVLVYALRFPRVALKPAAGSFFLILWFASVWLVSSDDPVRDAIVGFVLREDTAYANGFSAEGFRAIRPGQPDTEVRRLLGAPVTDAWIYSADDLPLELASTRSAASFSHECFAVRFEAGVVTSALNPDGCQTSGITMGMSPSEVQKRLGPPAERCWQYSWSPRGGRFRMRAVCFLNGRVAAVIRQWN